ncbi:M10 family metallopeptidase C-terminal domain-containing protein [Paracoccus spongiarum]|uniref:M10 family metallopeptidase C-terminal domain-containing protein n=1 Tax=Paracoccus spongiarum TaxID=3064387 RepID=A0ABT9JFZ3_9RHOB|nr:M10 family metallopeptidase C-terminal domain-containing protein [Paracoccus sp. 2205BS29-5]MDP5308755.1 M10 family metallopeptidase C-terminal domain-containing protein [Paracoccus sp. 2205BS29-5]
MPDIDMNRLEYGATGWDFANDTDLRFQGETYRDVYEYQWELPGYRYSSRYMGDDLAIDGAGRLSGGTVETYSERVWTGSDYWELWRMTGASIDADALQAAIDSPSTADDQAVYRQAFRGDDLFRLSINDDIAWAHRGNDTLRGAAGDDVLGGNAGNDRVSGEAGDDRLIGGAGRDHLTGGAGADVFVFNSAGQTRLGGADLIADFDEGEDLISLRGIDASTALGGNNAFVWLGERAIGTGAGGEIQMRQLDRAGTANDVTLLRIDTDADRAPEAELRLAGLHDLGADDFLL